MSRVEENEEMIKYVDEHILVHSDITIILKDISKSLAVIADSMSRIEASPTGAESEGGTQHD